MTLTPANSEVRWLNGHATVEREGEGVRVAAAFEHQEGDAVALHVEIENRGAAPFEVDPRWIAFTPCGTPATTSCLPARWARDPEEVLVALERQRAQEAVDASNAKAGLTILAIVSAVADVASIAEGRPSPTAGLGTLAALGARDEVGLRSYGTQAALEAQQQTFAAECLRRSTVAPGQMAAGRVLLPIELRARYLWLHLRAGSEKFSIPFHQTVIPDPDRMERERE